MIRKCKGCGCKLDDYCLDCQREAFDQAIAEANKRRQSQGKKGIIVFEDDPMYGAILARRDLDARTLEEK